MRVHGFLALLVILSSPTTPLFRSRRQWCARVQERATQATRRGSAIQRGASSAAQRERGDVATADATDRKSTRLNSSHLVISYAVYCLQKNRKKGCTIAEYLHRHYT